MADPRQDSAEADARVAAAKARLLHLAHDVRPGYQAAVQAASLVRARPWHGVGLALLAGVALGLAPREVLRRLSLLAPPVIGLLTGLGPRARPGVGGHGPTPSATGVRRER